MTRLNAPAWRPGKILRAASWAARGIISGAVPKAALMGGLVVLISSCVGPPPKPVTDLKICIDGRCGPSRKSRFTGKGLITTLYQMLKQNEGMDIQICEADPKTRKCVGKFTFFWQAGILPGTGTITPHKYRNISLNLPDLQVKFKTKFKATFMGSDVLCKTTDSTLTLPRMDELWIESASYYCNWAAIGNFLMNFRHAIDYLDFDRSILAGRYSLGGGGPMNAAGGQGYILIKFKKGQTLARRNAVPVVKWKGPSVKPVEKRRLAKLRKKVKEIKQRRAKTPIKNKIAHVPETEWRSSGSGFYLKGTTHITTNLHVVGSAKTIRVSFPDGAAYMGRVVAKDAKNDVAILALRGMRAKNEGVHVSLGAEVEPGMKVHAIGYPLGADISIVSGQVSSATGPDRSAAKFTMTAPINEGNSAGPIIDEKGNLIGIA